MINSLQDTDSDIVALEPHRKPTEPVVVIHKLDGQQFTWRIGPSLAFLITVATRLSTQSGYTWPRHRYHIAEDMYWGERVTCSGEDAAGTYVFLQIHLTDDKNGIRLHFKDHLDPFQEAPSGTGFFALNDWNQFLDELIKYSR